jgi:putative transposase
MILSYNYRIEPNQTQAAALDDMLRDFCQLYNAGIEQRIEAYRRQRLGSLSEPVAA